MTKSLLLKGLAGVAAVGGAATGGFVAFNKGLLGGGDRKPNKPQLEKSKSVDEFTQKELIDKVGLECGLTENELTDSETKECNVKTNGTISIKVGEKREDGVTFSSSTGSAKLKVSKSKKQERESRR